MGLNDNSNEEEYRFVEEHVVSRKQRIRRFFGKILVHVLLPVCICVIVCYIFLRSSGAFDDENPVETTEETTENGVIIEREESTTGELVEPPLSDEEILKKLEERLSFKVVVVSVEREMEEMDSEKQDETTAESESLEQNEEEQETLDGQKTIKEISKYTGAVVSASNHIYILIPSSSIEGYKEISVHLPYETSVEASVYDIDEDTGLALLKIESTKVPQHVRSKISVVAFSRNVDNNKGASVVYCGNVIGSEPMFIKGHVSNGSNQVMCTDLNYNLLITDIALANINDGFIFNSDGNLIGIVGLSYGTLEMPDVIAGGEAIDLRYIIDNMLNGRKDIYLGIKGHEVTSQIEEIVGTNMPEGIYVNSIVIDSPAYNAGLVTGDIIVSIGNITNPDMDSFRDFIEGKSKGDTVVIKVRRRIGSDYNEYTMPIVLNSRD